MRMAISQNAGGLNFPHNFALILWPTPALSALYPADGPVDRPPTSDRFDSSILRL